jgi:AcrR family transcriptional regulator
MTKKSNMSPMTALASRHTKRRLRTREALVAAAEELFAAKGPDAISIDEIVGAADVAKGSFYNHFADKDELARDIAKTIRTGIEDDVARINKDEKDPAARTARALCLYVRFALSNPRRARAMLKLLTIDLDTPLSRGLRTDMANGIASGRFKNVTREAAMLFVIGTVQACFQLAFTANANTVRRASEDMATLQLRGLGVADAEARKIAARATADVFANGRTGS